MLHETVQYRSHAIYASIQELRIFIQHSRGFRIELEKSRFRGSGIRASPEEVDPRRGDLAAPVARGAVKNHPGILTRNILSGRDNERVCIETVEPATHHTRITSYNVCYTKLLRLLFLVLLAILQGILCL